MRLSLFDYELPEELVAQHPSPEREGARLLVVGETCVHSAIAKLPDHVPEGALVLVNDTRVRRARLIGKKASGGRVEIFLLSQNPSGTWRALGRSSKPFRFPSEIEIEDSPLRVKMIGRREEILEVELQCEGMSIDDAIERYGRMPLPPYIRRAPDARDEDRYQTVYASKLGAVAAPTAGLHLTNALIERLRARRCAIEPVTLHVGLGTFQPVNVDDLDDHPMHAEVYDVPAQTQDAIARAKKEKRPVLAIGTTVVRAIESAALYGKSSGETRLLIQPGFSFRVTDLLLTNFHLPRSTLLALVCAFGGRDRMLAAYDEAVRERYRFFSYGDAMLVSPS